MCWLPGTSAIVVVTTEKKMMIVDAATKAVLYKTVCSRCMQNYRSLERLLGIVFLLK